MNSKLKKHKVAENISIYQGDCIDFLRSLPSESVDIIVTDPAYSGMNNKMQFGNGRIVGKYQNKDNDKWFQEFKDDPETFLIFLNECKRVLKDDRHIYLMIDSFSLLTLGHLMREVFNVKNIIVWDKINIGMGHYFRRRHEFVLFATKGQRKLNARNIPDVWRVKRIVRSNYPTQKPVEVFDYMLSGSTEKNFTVCDPFIGSGSSAIAAIKAGCSFIGADVSKKACELSADRIKHFLENKFDIFQKESALPENGNNNHKK
jgi:site-specific DNA-methyltransferase (adenine-specific)